MAHGDGSTRIEGIGALIREVARLDALATLAGGDGFATYLADRGRFGTQGKSDDCPLWHELTKELSYYLVYDWESLSFGQQTITLTLRAEPGFRVERLYLDTPQSLREFACRFDDGQYPALIARPAVSLVKV